MINPIDLSHLPYEQFVKTISGKRLPPCYEFPDDHGMKALWVPGQDDRLPLPLRSDGTLADLGFVPECERDVIPVYRTSRSYGIGSGWSVFPKVVQAGYQRSLCHALMPMAVGLLKREIYDLTLYGRDRHSSVSITAMLPDNYLGVLRLYCSFDFDILCNRLRCLCDGLWDHNWIDDSFITNNGSHLFYFRGQAVDFATGTVAGVPITSPDLFIRNAVSYFSCAWMRSLSTTHDEVLNDPIARSYNSTLAGFVSRTRSRAGDSPAARQIDLSGTHLDTTRPFFQSPTAEDYLDTSITMVNMLHQVLNSKSVQYDTAGSNFHIGSNILWDEFKSRLQSLYDDQPRLTRSLDRYLTSDIISIAKRIHGNPLEYKVPERYLAPILADMLRDQGFEDDTTDVPWLSVLQSEDFQLLMPQHTWLIATLAGDPYTWEDSV